MDANELYFAYGLCNIGEMDANQLDFAYHLDLLEEDALNRKSCIEVLRRIIPSTYTEIEELEGELFVLESQLEWAENNKHKEWFDICCKGLREQINSLELSISSLKEGNVSCELDNDVQAQVHEEPVKKLYDLIKSLLGNGFQDGDEQDALSQNLPEIVQDQEADITATVAIVGLNSSSTLQVGHEGETITSLEQVVVQKPIESITDTVLTLNPKSKLQGPMCQNQPVKFESNEVTAMNDTNNLHQKKGKNKSKLTKVEVKKPVESATCKVLTLNSRTKLKGAMCQSISDFVKVEETEVTATDNTDTLHQKKGKTMSKSKKAEIQKPIKSTKSRLHVSEVTSTNNTVILHQKKGKTINKLKKAEAQKSIVLAIDNTDSILSKSKLEGVWNSNQPGVKIQEADVAATSSTVGLNLLASQRQRQKKTSQSGLFAIHKSTELPMEEDLSSSLKRQRQRLTDLVRLDKIKGSDSSFSSINNAISFVPSLFAKQKLPKMQKKKAHSDAMAIQKPGVTLDAENSMAPKRWTRKRRDQGQVLTSSSIDIINLESLSSSPKQNKKGNVLQSFSDEVHEPSRAAAYTPINLNWGFNVQKKRKITKTETTEVEEANLVSDNDLMLQGILTESATQSDLQLAKVSDINDSHKQIVLASKLDPLEALTEVQLNELKLDELKSIAKKHGMKRYSHYKKDQLIQLLSEKRREMAEIETEKVKELTVASDKHPKVQEYSIGSTTRSELQLTEPSDVGESHNGILAVPRYSELKRFTLFQLKSTAKIGGLKGYAKLPKPKLIELLIEKQV